VRASIVLLILLSSALVLSGCADQDVPANQYELSGQFAMGDATLRYVATFVDSTLVRVEEEQLFGDLGEATATYEVVDGRLVAYRRDETRRQLGQDRAGTEEVLLELEFDARGRVQHQQKLVDGQARELLGHEAPGAQRHFAELRRRVDQRSAISRAAVR
jgi:hypothetical protein